MCFCFLRASYFPVRQKSCKTDHHQFCFLFRSVSKSSLVLHARTTQRRIKRGRETGRINTGRADSGENETQVSVGERLHMIQGLVVCVCVGGGCAAQQFLRPRMRVSLRSVVLKLPSGDPTSGASRPLKQREGRGFITCCCGSSSACVDICVCVCVVVVYVCVCGNTASQLPKRVYLLRSLCSSRVFHGKGSHYVDDVCVCAVTQAENTRTHWHCYTT